MDKWQEELIRRHGDESTDMRTVFSSIEKAARALEFDHVAYCYQASLPASKPRITLINNYPEAWRARYLEAGYLEQDPRIQRGMRSQRPIIWTDDLFSEVPALWHDACQYGLCHGWSQSVQDGPGGMGMTSLSRAFPPLSAKELNEKYDRMQWLAQMTHTLLSRLIRSKNAARVRHLTNREIEVLKWTADGKSSQDIADILTLSKNTVDFHIKNTVQKLNVPNKTAAVVQAVLLGLIH